MQSFCMANNLKALVHKASFPVVLRRLAYLIEQAFSGQSGWTDPAPLDFNLDTTLPGIFADPDYLAPLPPPIYASLLQRLATDQALSETTIYRHFASPITRTVVLNPNARVLPTVTYKGRRYSGPTSLGDSYVTFRPLSSSGTGRGHKFGQIQMIFLHHRRLRSGDFRHQVFAAVREFPALSLDDAEYDVYKNQAGLEARLVYSELSGAVEVIPICDIISHFVACPYQKPAAAGALKSCYVVVSLDQVR